MVVPSGPWTEGLALVTLLAARSRCAQRRLASVALRGVRRGFRDSRLVGAEDTLDAGSNLWCVLPVEHHLDDGLLCDTSAVQVALRDDVVDERAHLDVVDTVEVPAQRLEALEHGPKFLVGDILARANVPARQFLQLR